MQGEEGTPIKQDVKKGKLRHYYEGIPYNYGMLPQVRCRCKPPPPPHHHHHHLPNHILLPLPRPQFWWCHLQLISSTAHENELITMRLAGRRPGRTRTT